jgi:hypothetical protein
MDSAADARKKERRFIIKIMSDPRYPIGPFQSTPFATDAERLAAIAELRELPQQMKAALAELGPQRLDTPYREGGWTVRQLVHHVAHIRNAPR